MLPETVEGPRVRQLVLATGDLEGTVARITETLGLAVSHRVEGDRSHSEFALRAAVIPFGDQFLEVIEPTAAEAPATRHLARLGRDGGYMVIVQVPSLGQAHQRLRALKIEPIWEGDGGGGVHAIHLHPRDAGGTLLSLAAPHVPGTWSQGGPDWEAKVRTECVKGIERVSIDCRVPQWSASRWAAILGLPEPALGQTSIALRQGSIDFVPTDGPAHGPSAIVACADRNQAGAVAIGGFRISLAKR